MRQVAEQAGVSLGTASAVLSGKAGVSSEAQAAVRRAATAIGYRPRRPPTDGQPHAAAGVGSIGLLIRVMEHSLPTNPFYSAVLDGAHRACAALGIGLAYELVTGTTDTPGPLPLIVRRKEVDGLLLFGFLPDAVVADIAHSGPPCVLVDNSSDLAAVDSVRGDDEQGAYLATRHLLDLGHVDPVPAMITGPTDVPSIRDRLRGYRRAVVEAGLSPDPALLRSTTLSPAGGRAQMADLLDLRRPPTAVFCCNDATALGALATLRERGVSVPDDLSVVGYDDIEMAAHTVPPLTTVHVDKELMGAQSVWHLLQRIKHPTMTNRETRLAVSLVTRASSTRKKELSTRKVSTRKREM